MDDSNDHVLSVWDWQKEERLADVKVLPSPHLPGAIPSNPPILLISHGRKPCPLEHWGPIPSQSCQGTPFSAHSL